MKAHEGWFRVLLIANATIMPPNPTNTELSKPLEVSWFIRQLRRELVDLNALLRESESMGLRSSLWLPFKPHQIAAGASYLAVKSMNMDLTSSQHVWQEFQTPSSVKVFMISVAPGDVIVAATDGLFDNLFNDEVTSIVADGMREGLNPDALSQRLAASA
ncbi:hypothetical protein AgCh_004192 [Apium graveolens]